LNQKRSKESQHQSNFAIEVKMYKVLVSTLVTSVLVGALLLPHNVLACSTGQPGVHVSEYVEHITSVPTDGVLAFRAVLIDVAPEEAPDYFKVTVRSSIGTPVAGALDVQVLGPNPDERPLKPLQTAVGKGRVVVLYWEPNKQFTPEQTFDVSISVTRPGASFDFSFTTDAAPMDALTEPILTNPQMVATEHAGGTHKCCRVELDSCGREISCWDEDYVYHPTVEGTLEQVALPAGQVLYRLKRRSQVVATAHWFTDSSVNSSLSVEFLPEESEPFCVTLEAELLSDGSTAQGPEHCFDTAEIQAFERRNDNIPAPDNCVSEPFVDNDLDDQPDGDEETGDSGSDVGVVDASADTSETSPAGQNAGCGCRTIRSPFGSVRMIGVWVLILVGLACRRKVVSSS
jgi:hypothetical protein